MARDLLAQKGPRQPRDVIEERERVEYGNILPLRYDAEGTHFDPNAGIVGAVRRAVTLPGEVMRGEVDPMSDEGIDRAIEMGAVVSPTSAATRSGMGVMGAPVRGRRVTPSAPSALELKDTSRAQFRAMRESGAEYPGSLVGEFGRRMRADLEGNGIFEETAPGAYSIIKRLESPPEGSVATISQLHAARQGLGKVAQNFNNPTDQAAASSAIARLDDFIARVGERSPVAGRDQAARLLREANQNYAAGKRSKDITGIDYGADMRAAAANSGQNIGNAIRSRVASVLTQPRRRSGYSPEEIAALENLVQGSRAANLTRDIGNTLGGGGGIGTAVTGGGAAAAGGLVGGAPGAVAAGLGALATGRGSKALSNALTRRALSQVDEATRMRSPLYQQRLQAAPMQIPQQQGREALIRALLMQQMQMQNQPMGGQSIF